MAINPAYLEIRLSGGATNTDQNASLGGIKSSHVVRSKTVTGISNVTGVTVLDAPGSTNGSLAFTASGTTAVWTPTGGTASAAVNIGADGRYALQGANADASAGWLYISVTAASLPGTNQSDTLTVTAAANQTFDDISKVESYDGDVEYRCFYLHNAHPTDPFIGCKLYIGSDASGADSLAVGLDAAGVGDGSATGVAATVADESTAPTGVSFSAPATLGTALSLGQLNAGQSHGFWQRRTVPPATAVSTSSDLSELIFNVGY